MSLFHVYSHSDGNCKHFPLYTILFLSIDSILLVAFQRCPSLHVFLEGVLLFFWVSMCVSVCVYVCVALLILLLWCVCACCCGLSFSFGVNVVFVLVIHVWCVCCCSYYSFWGVCSSSSSFHAYCRLGGRYKHLLLNTVLLRSTDSILAISFQR